MAITWGRSNVGGGSTVGASTGGSGGYSRTVSNSGGNVLGANYQASAPTPVRRASTPVAQTQQPMQSQQQDYSAGIDMGGVPDTDSIYAPMESYLGQVEQQLRGDLPTYQKEAESNYNANKSSLDTSKNSTLLDIAGQKTAGDRKYEDAATAARRLYNEQQMGINQRFGGASSAGEAGRAVLGQSMQQQLGANQRGAIDFNAQIGRETQKVNDTYNSEVLKLDAYKQTALAQIQRDFQSKLFEIANNRAQLAAAKAQARVQAVMDLRNKTFAVQMQDMQFKQALDAQKASALTSYGQYSNQLSGSSSAASGAQQAFNPNAGSALSMNYQDNSAPTTQYQYGQMGYQPKKEEQLFYNSAGNAIGGRSVATPYQYS